MIKWYEVKYCYYGGPDDNYGSLTHSDESGDEIHAHFEPLLDDGWELEPNNIVSGGETMVTLRRPLNWKAPPGNPPDKPYVRPEVKKGIDTLLEGIPTGSTWKLTVRGGE